MPQCLGSVAVFHLVGVCKGGKSLLDGLVFLGVSLYFAPKLRKSGV